MKTAKTTVVNRRAFTFDVYIGRGSKWGNPYRIGEHGDRDAVVTLYELWLEEHPELIAALPELQGKVLGCFCKPAACHGDILARLADASAEIKNDSQT